METKKVLEHTCFQKNHPLSPVRCRCRKYITTVEAAILVSRGASFVVKGYKNAVIEEICPVCEDQEKLRKSCAHCNKTGKLTVNKKIPVYGDDIITSVGEKGRKLENRTAKRTPRSPTIEKNHILRSIGAIGSGAEAAKERLNEYQLLTLKERIRLMVPRVSAKQFDDIWRRWLANDIMISLEVHSKEWLEKNDLPFPLPFKYEPLDDVETMTGRRYDYGRSV